MTKAQDGLANSGPTSYRREPFEISDRRAMVSLGPLSARRYCTFRCPFCYVHADYDSFQALKVDQIVEWIRRQDQTSFDTVYVSGDTDSFAPPRLSAGLDLLDALVDVGKDVLFTTR